MSVPNRTLSQRWFNEAWNERSDDILAEVVCPNCVGHMESGDIVGAEPFKLVRGEFLAAIPDLTLTVEDMVSDGNDVVTRWSAVGTHTGEGLGLAPTGQTVQVNGMTWHRYRDGKMVEVWDSWNQEALLQRLREGSDEHRERSATTRSSLATRLRELRIALFGEDGGPEMARFLNVPPRTWYNYETGVAVPGEILLEIIEKTGVRPLWLLKGEGPRFEEGRESKV